ncbi:MAG: 3-deoxy-D-manno-octulosonic acid transferase [Spartobacteria bacterium]|nr:3-deoxy-D-manno-octulosonic acid transferase [Spartobacteria bacterium]
MIWFFYNILFVVGFVILLPRFLYRMLRRGGYARHFFQRFGCYSPEIRQKLASGEWVWIQAVSVGEFFVAFQFMEEIRARNPSVRFVLSTNTSTGYALAGKRMHSDDVLVYFPVDFPWITRRVFNSIRPTCLILIECELWPNLIRIAHAKQVPTVLVNGRISAHSYKGYRKLRVFTSRILPMVDLLCVQSRADAERLIALGAGADRVHVLGSAKYEVVRSDPAGEENARSVLTTAGMDAQSQILLGGSTWAGEEAVLMDIYKELKVELPRLALILVPRHVERAPEVLKEIQERKLSVVRRSEVSQGRSASSAPDILLVDTTGELMHFYPCADVIFIGKSLTQHGGQNIIEPAFFSKAVVVGPNMENFPVVMEDFIEARAVWRVDGVEALKDALKKLLASEEWRGAQGARAGRLVRKKAGAVRDTVDLCALFLPKK